MNRGKLGFVHGVEKSRTTMRPASGTPRARKKIQANVTKEKQINRRAQAGIRGASRDTAAISSVATLPRAWRAPQRTNVHDAPCHNPDASIVRVTLRTVFSRLPRLPPSGM